MLKELAASFGDGGEFELMLEMVIATFYLTNQYRVIHPLVRQVLKMRIWGVPLAGGLLLWLITALAGPRNLSKNVDE